MSDDDKKEFTDRDGLVLSPEDLAWLYSREGRWKDGREFPNPTPIDPPIGFVPTEPIHEQIARMVHRELAKQSMRNEEFDSEEEAEDFDVDDDFDPSTPYEQYFDPQEPWPPRDTPATGTVPPEPSPPQPQTPPQEPVKPADKPKEGVQGD